MTVTLEEVVRSEEKAPNRPELVYSSLLSAKLIPEKPWRSQKGNVHMIPVMVGIEGIRVDIPDPDTPLARWRSNLRESLSYVFHSGDEPGLHDPRCQEGLDGYSMHRDARRGPTGTSAGRGNDPRLCLRGGDQLLYESCIG